jgi:hypothetical protein
MLVSPDPGPQAAQPGAHEQRRAGIQSERFRQVAATFAGSATAGRILPAMISSTYQGFRTAPIPSGWVQTGERWDLWWNGRSVANVTPEPGRGALVHLDARKIFETKEVFAASLSQGRRYAERWCAVRLYPDLPMREAVTKLTDGTPMQPPPGLPPTREQLQQARRLAEAGVMEVERIKEALEPRKPQAETRPQAKDPIKGRIRRGGVLRDMRKQF